VTFRELFRAKTPLIRELFRGGEAAALQLFAQNIPRIIPTASQA
jgi:hypothetical protein